MLYIICYTLYVIYYNIYMYIYIYIVLSIVQHYSILYFIYFLVQIQRNNDKRCKNRDKTTAFEKAFVSSVCIKKEESKKYIYCLS